MDEKNHRHYGIKTILYISGACWGSAAYGYGASVIATTLGQPSFIVAMGLDSNPRAPDIIGAIVAMFYVGGVFSSIAVALLADSWGRKPLIMCGSLISLVSLALSAGSVHPAMMIVFRFFLGLGSCIMLTLIPVWINEIVPPKDRGLLNQINPIFLNLGYVVASYVGVGFFNFQGSGHEWRGPLALGCVPNLLCIGAIYFVPESPRFLLMKGKKEEAWKIVSALHTFRDDNTFAEQEFALMQDQIEIERMNRISYREICMRPSYRRRVYIGCGLPFITMSTGVLVLNNYATLLYAGLGFDSNSQLHLQAGGLINAFVWNVAAVSIVDRFPRRILIAMGLVGCLATMCSFAALSATYIGTTNEAGLRAGVAMIFIFGFFFGMCLDGPTYFYLGEIFPSHIRAQGQTLGMVAFNVANIIWLQAAPPAFTSIGWKYYLTFIIITVLGLGFVVFTFPDTRNIPLEEIGKLFGDPEELVATRATDEKASEVKAKAGGNSSHEESVIA